MSVSGIDLHEEAAKAYEEMKLKHNCELMAFEIVEKKVIKKKDAKDTCTYEDFLSFMEDYKDKCLYIVYDIKVKENPTRKKLVLINWAPDTANVTAKMVYASSVAAIHGKLEGVKGLIQCNDAGDLEIKNLVEEAKRL